MLQNSEIKRPPDHHQHSQQPSLRWWTTFLTSKSPKQMRPNPHNHPLLHKHTSSFLLIFMGTVLWSVWREKRPEPRLRFETGEGKKKTTTDFSLRLSSGNLSTSCALWPSTVCFFFFSSFPAVVVLPPHSSSSDYTHTHTHTHTAFMTKRGCAVTVWAHLILHLQYTVYTVCEDTGYMVVIYSNQPKSLSY